MTDLLDGHVGLLDLSRVDWGSESCCGGRRSIRVGWRSGVPGTWVPLIHSPCPHNEVAAILKRSLGRHPPQVDAPLGHEARAVFARLARLAGLYDGGTWSHLETALSYKGAMRRRYLEAERSLREDGPVRFRDWYLRPFLKTEKVNAMRKWPKPRLIYPRSPRFNLALASRLKPFEHWLWGRLVSDRLFRGGSGRVVAKGLNPRQRANLIVRKKNNLARCVVVEVDAVGFEAHVGRSWLADGEHAVYRRAFPGDRGLDRLLRAQETLEGTLPCGAKFSREGGRASGDFNTGMGNSLVMLAVCVAAMRGLCNKYDLLVDGDNALVFLPGAEYSRVMQDFPARVTALSGHELTLEAPTAVTERITFGQSSPVYLGPKHGWTMVRNPFKVLSCALSSYRWLREPVFAREWIRGVAACELSLALGVPVLQEWALGLQRQWGGPEGVRLHPHADLVYQGAWAAGEFSARVVTPEARVSFERAFGISVPEQLVLEQALPGTLAFDLEAWDRVEPTSFDLDAMPPGFTVPARA